MRITLLTATRLLVSTVLLVTLGVAAPAWAHCGFPHAGQPGDHEVVLHVATGPGFFAPAGSEVTIRANGEVVIDPRGRGGEPVTLTISHRRLHELLRDARRAGLLREVDVGDANITDQATTTIEVRTGHHHQQIAVYALFFGGAGYGPSDLGLTHAQRVARGHLADFVGRLDDPKTYDEPTAVDTVEHPSRADDVVLRTDTSRNYWGGDYPDAVAFTLYGDGRLVTEGGTTRHLTDVEMQALLRAAQDVGLLGGTDFGHPLVTDQGTTAVEVHAGGIDHTLELYALELVEGDRGLPAAQRHAREALRNFLHGVGASR